MKNPVPPDTTGRCWGDRRHQVCCTACGERFDARDLMAVLEHQHRTEQRVSTARTLPDPFPFRIPTVPHEN